MKKFYYSPLVVLILVFLSTMNTFADNHNQWKYSKEVHYENQEEVKAIYLDEDIYRYAKEDLSDLRLINEKNQFIPYYIYNRFLSENKVEYTEYTSEEVLSFRKKMITTLIIK